MFSYVFFIALLVTYGAYRLIQKAVRKAFNITTAKPTRPTTTTTTTPPPTTRTTRPKKNLRNKRRRPTPSTLPTTTISRSRNTLRNTRHPDWHHLKEPHLHPELIDLQLRKHLHNTTTTTHNPYFWTTSSSTTVRIIKTIYPTRRIVYRLGNVTWWISSTTSTTKSKKKGRGKWRRQFEDKLYKKTQQQFNVEQLKTDRYDIDLSNTVKFMKSHSNNDQTKLQQPLIRRAKTDRSKGIPSRIAQPTLYKRIIDSPKFDKSTIYETIKSQFKQDEIEINQPIYETIGQPIEGQYKFDDLLIGEPTIDLSEIVKSRIDQSKVRDDFFIDEPTIGLSGIGKSTIDKSEVDDDLIENVPTRYLSEYGKATVDQQQVDTDLVPPWYGK